MVIEFQRHGKVYQCTHDAAPGTKTIQLLFKPCALKPPFYLELEYRGRDEIRMIEIYAPVREIR